MPASTAEALSAALDELYHGLPNHPPKHVILSAIVRQGLADRGALRAALRQWRAG